MINNDGTLGQLVDVHAEMHMQHTNAQNPPLCRTLPRDIRNASVAVGE